MFQFKFDLDDADDGIASSVPAEPKISSETIETAPFVELNMKNLLEAMPPAISYSLVGLTGADGAKVSIARRDLFDARFQLIDGDDDQPLEYIDSPSDLVPGKYEGGFKTWEASHDLAGYLFAGTKSAKGHRVLEIGCGSAIPSMYLLQEIFSSKEAASAETHLHLQDYNTSVLELITLPNVVLAWYFSPAAEQYRSGETDDPESAGELQITLDQTLKSAFLEALHTYKISIRLYAGSWETFPIPDERYDTVLTSETIYRTDSLPSLINLLKATCSPSGQCLVAAKVLYFGVGGGISDFVKQVEQAEGTATSVWSKEEGVGRKIMSVHWT